jgi:hypothetical protein
VYYLAVGNGQRVIQYQNDHLPYYYIHRYLMLEINCTNKETVTA